MPRRRQPDLQAGARGARTPATPLRTRQDSHAPGRAPGGGGLRSRLPVPTAAATRGRTAPPPLLCGAAGAGSQWGRAGPPAASGTRGPALLAVSGVRPRRGGRPHDRRPWGDPAGGPLHLAACDGGGRGRRVLSHASASRQFPLPPRAPRRPLGGHSGPPPLAGVTAAPACPGTRPALHAPYGSLQQTSRPMRALISDILVGLW